MKQILFAASIALTMAACNQQPQTKAMTQDTVGQAAMQALQQQHITDSLALVNQVQASHVVSSTHHSTARSTSGSGSSTKSTTMSSESSNTAVKKKGWSKTAKGAVIGGVVGAGTGAIINKKNRAAGAVIGGVVGAGAGAVIGNQQDKKDGRH
jgi:membrane-bound lytic murein transglycosylase